MIGFASNQRSRSSPRIFVRSASVNARSKTRSSATSPVKRALLPDPGPPITSDLIIGSALRPSIAVCGGADLPLRSRLTPPGPQVMQSVSNPGEALVSTMSPGLPSLRSTACNRPDGWVISPRPCRPVLASSQPNSRSPARALGEVFQTMNKVPWGGVAPRTDSTDLPSKRITCRSRPLSEMFALIGASAGSGGVASPARATRFGQRVTRPFASV